MTRLLVVLGVVGAVGCGGDNAGRSTSKDSASLLDRLARLDRDLAPGSQGEDVRAVQDFLTAHGYFPNQTLARTYPAWRPIVPALPGRMGFFDASTAAAVRAAQRYGGLSETGVVDRATRALLRTPRCGVPDGIPALDPRDKFAVRTKAWSFTDLTWRYIHDNAPGDLVVFPVAVRSAINSAFAQWADVTNLTFRRLDPTDTSAWITFVWSDDTGGNSAVTNPTVDSPVTVKVNRSLTWSTATPTPANAVDYGTVVIHEIGHALGLYHSSVGNITTTVMAIPPALGFNNRFLGSDDVLAISTLYDPWVGVPGCVKDLAVGNDESVWVVSCDDVVRKRDGNGYHATSPQQTAKAIAVDSAGQPWVVAPNGTVLAHNSSSPDAGQWIAAPGGCARDIGASSNIWIIGCAPDADGPVRRWNGTDFDQDGTGFSGRRIAVELAGNPWVIRSDGSIYRRSSSNPATGTFNRVGNGNFFGPDGDIGVALSGAFVQAWVIDTIASPPDIYVWNQQPGAMNDMIDPPKNVWVQVAGHSNRVSVGPNNPWVAAINLEGGMSPMANHPPATR
jgi:peptidoglycan hydrolase-like protein with peptidoglycan-binding domain